MKKALTTTILLLSIIGTKAQNNFNICSYIFYKYDKGHKPIIKKAPSISPIGKVSYNSTSRLVEITFFDSHETIDIIIEKDGENVYTETFSIGENEALSLDMSCCDNGTYAIYGGVDGTVYILGYVTFEN